MKSVVILFLAIVAIVVFGCGQPQTQMQTLTSRVASCTTTDLLNKVHFLQIPFDPRQNSSPQPSNVPVPANIQNDLCGSHGERRDPGDHSEDRCPPDI